MKKYGNMKKLIVLVCSMALLVLPDTQAAISPGQEIPGDQLEVYCSPDLLPLLRECKRMYVGIHPDSHLQLGVVEDQSLPGVLTGPGQVAFVTKSYLDDTEPGTANVRVVGREIYVPVMNPDNPYRDEITRQGISPSEFAAIYSGTGGISWGYLLEESSEAAIKSYRTADPSFTAYLSGFTGNDAGIIGGEVMEDCEKVVAAIKADRLAVGFCTLSQLADMEQEGDPKALVMIPVDMNENNRMDHFEHIYGNTDELKRGIWIGKYDGHLYSRIYAVTPAGEIDEQVAGLLRWIVEGGQEVFARMGYSPLSGSEQEVLLAGLENPVKITPGEETGNTHSRAALVIISILIAGGIIVYAVLAIFNERTGQPSAEPVQDRMIEASYDIPGGYFFDRSHTWTFLEKDGNIRIGLDNFMSKVTGRITKVDLKQPGEKIRKGQTVFSIIQNGKRLDIKSPVSGTISERNGMLAKNASLINVSPFEDGWVYMIEPADWMEEFTTYMKSQKYREWIQKEVIRLKDFLASISDPPVKTAVILQEGGEPEEGVLRNLGPEVWEDFQSDFLN